MNELLEMKLELGAIQSYVLVGSHERTSACLISFLKKNLCVCGMQGHCATCSTIENHQHYAMMWLSPREHYTLEQFDPVLARLAIALDHEEQFFIVIQKADFLSQMCANRLLKVLEEPPRGYYFFLLVERINEVIPTIRSRCAVYRIDGEDSLIRQQNLFNCFTTVGGYDPILFVQYLRQSEISEQESVELFDKLVSFWSGYYKRSLTHNDEIGTLRACDVLKILKNTAAMLPMPGSSNLFWKNLYLQMEQSLN